MANENNYSFVRNSLVWCGTVKRRGTCAVGEQTTAGVGGGEKNIAVIHCIRHLSLGVLYCVAFACCWVYFLQGVKQRVC